MYYVVYQRFCECYLSEFCEQLNCKHLLWLQTVSSWSISRSCHYLYWQNPHFFTCPLFRQFLYAGTFAKV